MHRQRIYAATLRDGDDIPQETTVVSAVYDGSTGRIYAVVIETTYEEEASSGKQAGTEAP